jgi:hypothetical protein
MRPTRPVAKKATRRSLDDEIAHLRDLDLHGLRARWKSMFRQQPPPHLPRHLLFAVLAYRLQVDELGDLDPATARLLRQIATGGGTLGASRRMDEFGRRRAEPGSGLRRRRLPLASNARCDGRLPRGVGIANLRDAPAEWSLQYTPDSGSRDKHFPH